MHFYERRFQALVDRIRSRMQRPGGAGGVRRPREVMRSRAPPSARRRRRGRRGPAGPAFPPRPERRRRVARLREALRVRGVDADALERIVELAESGDDLELDRIRVRRLAREWRLDERPVIRMALHATRAGLLQLTWDVLCPHCRGVRRKLASLGEVPERGECDVCAIEFGTEGENAIEVTFRVHPSIREVPDAVYCSAQPMRRGHIQLQQRVERAARARCAAPLAPGRYRLRRRGRARSRSSTWGGHAAGRAGGVERGPAPSRTEVGPDPVFVLRAPAGRRDLRGRGGGSGTTTRSCPVHLFNMQDFRDLFSEEYLAAGVRLYVGEQTILFSDIVGSTRLYAEAGDPAAFIEVKKHFAQIYERGRGALRRGGQDHRRRRHGRVLGSDLRHRGRARHPPPLPRPRPRRPDARSGSASRSTPAPASRSTSTAASTTSAAPSTPPPSSSAAPAPARPRSPRPSTAPPASPTPSAPPAVPSAATSSNTTRSAASRSPSGPPPATRNPSPAAPSGRSVTEDRSR